MLRERNIRCANEPLSKQKSLASCKRSKDPKICSEVLRSSLFWRSHFCTIIDVSCVQFFFSCCSRPSRARRTHEPVLGRTRAKTTELAVSPPKKLKTFVATVLKCLLCLAVLGEKFVLKSILSSLAPLQEGRAENNTPLNLECGNRVPVPHF